MKRIWSTLGYYLLIAAAAGWAQETKKAGLWLVATTTEIQQQGETSGNFVARGNKVSPGGAEGGLPVCLTHELIEKYGVILPPSLKDCQLSNVVQASDSFKADMSCKGGYNGVGSVESKWSDADHVTGKIRFVSRTRGTENGRSMTWTQESSAVFKGSDCGAVKPRRIPSADATK
jgi:hypothetical protein